MRRYWHDTKTCDLQTEISSIIHPPYFFENILLLRSTYLLFIHSFIHSFIDPSIHGIDYCSSIHPYMLLPSILSCSFYPFIHPTYLCKRIDGCNRISPLHFLLYNIYDPLFYIRLTLLPQRRRINAFHSHTT